MSQSDTFASGDAQILDRGYRPYDGPRGGIGTSQMSVVTHSVQRALGMRRSVWAKLLPIAGAAIAYIPAIVFVGVVALVDFDEADEFLLPSYGLYYGYIIAALALFSALVAPEVLCTDRRSGMLGVYLASPLTRDRYLAAKGAAIAFVLSLVCLGPTLLMLVANILQSHGPDGIDDIALTAVRVIVAGLVITAMHTGITMGVASLTDRKAIAFGAVALLFLVTLTVAGTLSATSEHPGGIRVISPWMLTMELATRVHGEPSEVMPGASSAAVWIGWAVWTFGGFGLAWDRLRRLAVTR